MAQPLRFGTYTEIQGPPGRNHAELIWDIVALAEHSDQIMPMLRAEVEKGKVPRFGV